MRKLGRKLRKPMKVVRIQQSAKKKESDKAFSTFNMFESPVKSNMTLDSDYKISPRQALLK